MGKPLLKILPKNHPLQGEKATVILPVDPDGDIGVVFKENIGAGSLDGMGPNGHCLYIPEKSLKKSE